MQDHRWWWPSFLTSAGVALYMFLYSVYYFKAKMHIVDFVPALLYFGYSTLMSLTFFVMSGAFAMCVHVAYITRLCRHHWLLRLAGLHFANILRHQARLAQGALIACIPSFALTESLPRLLVGEFHSAKCCRG